MGSRQVHHPDPGGDQRGTALRAGQQGSYLGGVLGVVQQHQHPAAVQHRPVQRGAFLQGVRYRGVRGAQRPQERAQYGLRLGGAGARALEVDVQLAVGEGGSGLVGHVDGEGRLAHPADSRERRHRHHATLRRGQDIAQFGDEGHAAGEVRDRRRELVGADRCRHGLRRRCGGLREARVGLEDAVLEFAQAGARVHAQLVGEQAPGVRVHGQGLRLAAGAVQREHQQLAEAFTERVGRGEGGQLADGLRVAALLQVHVEAGFEELEPPLLQPDPLSLRVGPRESGQRLAVPQRERPAQQVPRTAQVTRRLRLLRLVRQVVHLGHVQRALGQPPYGISARLADQHPGVQRLAQPGRVRPHRGQRLRRRVVTPQRVDQLTGGRRAALAQQQRGQQGALLRRARVQRNRAPPGTYRTEHAEAQRGRLLRAGPGAPLLRYSRSTVHRRSP